METNSAGQSVNRAKILVTDDDRDIQKITELNLSREGFYVLQAYTGVECLEKTKIERPDIILLDLVMPDMDGFETCKRLKSVDSTRDIPVIMVTVREAIQDRLKCFSFKADDYVVKPYDFGDLLSRIYLHLNRSIELKEREQRQRTAILREVLREVSERVGRQYQRIETVVEAIRDTIDAGHFADLHTASSEIIHIVEETREREDPFYESPFLEGAEHYEGESDNDFDDILEDVPLQRDDA